MLKMALLLSLISGFSGSTNFPFNTPNVVSHFDGSNPSHFSEKILAQQTQNPRLETEGFLFEFTGCKLAGDNRICDFTVVNQQQRRYLYICAPKTKIVDSAGRELIASQVVLGAKKAGGCVRNQLSTNIPTKASATFNGLIGSNIILFDINASKFNVEFKQQ